MKMQSEHTLGSGEIASLMKPPPLVFNGGSLLALPGILLVTTT